MFCYAYIMYCFKFPPSPLSCFLGCGGIQIMNNYLQDKQFFCIFLLIVCLQMINTLCIICFFGGGYYWYNFLFLGMLIKLTGEVPFLSIPMISHRLFFTFLKADIFTRSLQSDIWLVVLALPCSDLFLLLVSI